MGVAAIFTSTTTTAGWWFGTFFIFPYIWNNHPNWRILFRGAETTNQTGWAGWDCPSQPNSGPGGWIEQQLFGQSCCCPGSALAHRGCLWYLDIWLAVFHRTDDRWHKLRYALIMVIVVVLIPYDLISASIWLLWVSVCACVCQTMTRHMEVS